jgi:hypothetical protein
MEGFLLTENLGWTQLYGLRVCQALLYARGREEPASIAEARCWSYLRRGGADLYLSIVREIPRYPLQPLTSHSDVLRRRFQINTMSGVGYQYKSVLDAITMIVSQEGLRGLYKGIVPNLLKVAPSMASSWLSFEMTRDFFVSLGQPDGAPAA